MQANENRLKYTQGLFENVALSIIYKSNKPRDKLDSISTYLALARSLHHKLLSLYLLTIKIFKTSLKTKIKTINLNQAPKGTNKI